MHIFLPFFGGPDDRLALEFVVGLCRRNERLRATVVRLKKVESGGAVGATTGAGGTIPGAEGGDKGKTQGDRNEEVNVTTVASNIAGFPDTVYGYTGTEVRMQSDTADNIIWARYASPRPTVTRTGSSSSSASSSKSPVRPEDEAPSRPIVPRVTFKEVVSAKPLHAALDEAYAIQQLSTNHNRTGKASTTSTASVGVVVITGRSRRLAVESHRAELKELMLEDSHHHSGGSGGHGDVTESGMMREVKKTLGEVGSAFVGRGVGVGVWILQAALDGER